MSPRFLILGWRFVSSVKGPRISIIGLRFRSLFSRPSVERELDEELQYHLERQIEENVTAGMSHEDTRVEAVLSITGITQRKEECRDMRGFNFIDNLWRDFRYSLRQLGKNRGFTFTAIFVLALGMCACVSIFSFVDAALIKPLPYRNPARLVGVFESISMCHFCNISYLDYLDWKQRNVVFSSFEHFLAALNLAGFVTEEFFEAVPLMRPEARRFTEQHGQQTINLDEYAPFRINSRFAAIPSFSTTAPRSTSA